MSIAPPRLTGTHVVLEALGRQHCRALADVGLDPELWAWIPTPVRSLADMDGYVNTALEEQRQGMSIPFVIIERTTGDVIGSTRYANLALSHRRLEIGWTWITPSRQRTAVNTETKLLLLDYAFGTLDVARVEFKTDALNERSHAAILRIGAKQEGIFRKHMVLSDGRVRDTVYFSIIDAEWPDVRAHLIRRLS